MDQQILIQLEDEDFLAEYDLSSRDVGLYRRATQLITFLDCNPDTLVHLSPATRESTEFKKRGRGKAPKAKRGGKPPIEFGAVETKIDLEAALRCFNTRAVRSNYFRLARMVGW